MPNKNFSFDLLQQVPQDIMTIELHDVLWSDWGQPKRIEETLQKVKKEPAFSRDYLAAV